jgi:hypothetical protein
MVETLACDECSEKKMLVGLDEVARGGSRIGNKEIELKMSQLY